MINVELAEKLYWENDVEGYVIFLNEDFKSSVDLSQIEEEYPHLKSMLKKHTFKGKNGQSFTLTASKNKKLIHYVFIGLGKSSGIWQKDLESLRRAVGAAVLKLKSLEVDSSIIKVPDDKIFGLEKNDLLKEMVVTALMASYEFTDFKSAQKTKWVSKILFSANSGADEIFAKSLQEAKIIADAVNQTRLLCDMPPNIATPTYVSDKAKDIAKDILGLKCAVFGRKKAQELGMGGFLSVDSGSEQEGKFVILEYDCGNKDVPTIVLVGKGVTFDSGGISLKPASYMTGMKFDMSGASAVIGVMKVIAQLKPQINVIGLTPLVENMPSGRSNRQDDIVTFMNGKTAEIVNTDAEGRLILADALCYAEKFYEPDVIIDVATLTGACVHALGHFYTGLMTKDPKLAGLLENSSHLTGDRILALPLDDDFKKAIKSEVADISNAGSPAYKAGTITAALFLSNFVEKAAWAHLDIAGTADGVPDVNYLGKGATGVGVRLLVDFILKYKK